jgi:hypothetical protein
MDDLEEKNKNRIFSNSLEFEKKACECGFFVPHPMISAVGKYTWFGWICVTLVGITTRPVRVNYVCRQCNFVLKSCTDRETLDSFI